MLFKDIIGQEKLKNHLIQTVNNRRISHAQLFIAPKGSGALPLAIAYAQYILCHNKDLENNLGDEACNLKFEKLVHPDLHFAFPVAINEKVKKHPVSNLFLEEWRKFIKNTPYGSLFNWYQKLGIENKQGQIGVDEAEDIVKKLVLKSYEGGYKVMIIWMAEKMNISASNKLLKLIEEHIKALSKSVIKEELIKKFKLSEYDAEKIAHQSNGDWNKAIRSLNQNDNEDVFERWFGVMKLQKQEENHKNDFYIIAPIFSVRQC